MQTSSTMLRGQYGLGRGYGVGTSAYIRIDNRRMAVAVGAFHQGDAWQHAKNERDEEPGGEQITQPQVPAPCAAH